MIGGRKVQSPIVGTMFPDNSNSPAETVDLSNLATEMAPELRCLLGPTISLVTGTLPAGGTPLVRVRREEIVDLLRHLALDAHDAMRPGGTVTIRTGLLREVTACAALVIHEVPAAATASGHVRKGRSLGLGASYDMIERAGGHFHVSCRGRETVLTICFPLAE
jgi:hypothetical protein